MTQEQFEALGIEKSLAEKAAKESKKELEGYVEKSKYEESEQQRKQLETSANDYKTQLESLKESAGDNETLKQQIAQLQEQNKQKDADYQKELKDMKLTNAIKLAITASAQDADLVTGLIDKEKLILGDDGKVTGLDEQIKSLKETKAFLFKPEESPKPKPNGFFPTGNKIPPKGGEQMSMKDAIAAKLNINPEGGK